MAAPHEPSGETALKAVFFLQDPSVNASENICIEPLKGAATIMELIKRAFLLDVENIQAAAGQFNVIQKLVSARPMFYSLQYPRQYSQLKDVREAIVTTLMSSVSAHAVEDN